MHDGLVFGADKVVGGWVAERCGCKGLIEPSVAIGVVDNQMRLLAGCVFHSYQEGCDVTVTMAARRPSLRLRSAIRAGLLYAFDQLSVPRVTAEIPLENERSIKLAKGLGFVREGVKRRAAGQGKHVGVYGLLRKDFRL